MWLEDERFPRGKGRLETKLLNAAGSIAGTVDIAPGNGSRVALILALNPGAAMTIADFVRVGPIAGGVIAPVRTLCAGIMHCAIKLSEDGDVVLQAFRALASANVTSISVWEVLWHPEGR